MKSLIRSNASGSGDAETVIVRGQVTPGRGKGSSYVERHGDKIRDALGATMVKGSLNVLLKRPVMLREETAVKTCFDGGVRLDWPGRLNGIEVWLHRWESAPLHIVELLGTVHLRSHLHLADGDEVAIVVRKCDIEPVSTLGRIAWLLLWFGRRRWCYSNGRYWQPAQRWSEQFGATQLGTDQNVWDFAVALIKMGIKKVPGVPWLWQRLWRSGGKAGQTK